MSFPALQKSVIKIKTKELVEKVAIEYKDYKSSGTCPGHFPGGADRKICRQNMKNMPTNYERFGDRFYLI